MDEHRVNELLNVLAMTVGMLREEGVRVVARMVEAGVELRVGAHLCERCKRLSADSHCTWCGETPRLDADMAGAERAASVREEARGAGGDALTGEKEAGKSSRAYVQEER